MKRWMYNALIIIFAGVFLVCGVILAKYFIESAQQKSKYDKLANIMAEAPTTPRPTVSDDPDVTVSTDPTEPTMVDVVDPETGEIVTMLPQFAELYKLNNHLVGWIKIPGTDIDYPVMQNPEQEAYYLRRDFEHNYSTQGSIYIEEACDIFTPSDNITVYGHRMRDRSMFGQLDKYLDESFCEEYPYIYFDSIKQLHTYQILSVFITTASVGEGFRYHAFVDADSPEDFNRFVSNCKELSRYDTGVTAEYGDKLICLSTCDYSLVNGRLVIVAKRIS